MKRKSQKSSRGFSVIEALVAAGILAIALVGVVYLHGNSIRGTAQAERIGRAAEAARQYAEMFATTTPGRLPACAPGIGNPAPLEPAGCRRDLTSFRAGKGTGCTFWVTGGPSTPSIDDPAAANGAIIASVTAEALPNEYRIDVAVSDPPGNAAAGAALLTVWTCWRDENGKVSEIRTRRIVY